MISHRNTPKLRVAFVAGGLGQGGAEKQLVYMVRQLAEAGVDVRVYCLTRGDHYESVLETAGIAPVWVGWRHDPLRRLLHLTRALRTFRPHIVQSAHFFTNLYVTAAARWCDAVAIGGIRNDGFHDVETTGRWGRRLLRWPPALLANSYAARRNAETMGVVADRIVVLPNVIDVSAFDADASPSSTDVDVPRTSPLVVTVASLRAAKRLDRFLQALALARQQVPALRGCVVGDGVERDRLLQTSRELGLLPDGVEFCGRRDDVARILANAEMFLLTSDHEGFPNVLLEAMTARLPVVTTPAGDAGVVTQDGSTGFVVPFDAIERMAARLVELAGSPSLRRQLGDAGRARVLETYSVNGLADRLRSAYRVFAARQQKPRVQALLGAESGVAKGLLGPDDR